VGLIALIPPTLWKAFGAVLLLAALYGLGWKDGRSSGRESALLEQFQQIEQARSRERQTNHESFKLREIKDAEIDRINGRLSSALERLRARPERLSEPARAACHGATGAELSGRDAGAFERLAARADRLRAALAECQGWIEQVSAR
jgi:hypothetical protein